ncbi:MAG: prephenate dehydrogenase/arogenate dehydrogenase family protein [Candidatus Kapabacteria bacterium]|jgi:prephenate dehydrogenase|nr:prephenate dehydrogenase/arogenate dehydrogenase family protein [Candidatus Kapabacteria bacterium]
MTKNQQPTTRNQQTIGIIGYGRFGKLLARSLSRDFAIRVFEPGLEQQTLGASIDAVSLRDAVLADYVFVCVPIVAFESAMQVIEPLLPEGTPVLDVCSVKVHPTVMMRKYLRAKSPILPTHPMFGPVSAKDGWTNLPFVLCPEPDATPQEMALLRFWEEYIIQKQGARAITMSADEHDRITAYNLCLTQLLGRVLGNIGIQSSPIDAQSFKHLLSMKEMSYSDSMELLIGMHRFNPYSNEMRSRLRAELQSIETIIAEY